MVRLALRLFVPAVLLLGAFAQAGIYERGLADQPIRSDGISYHVYLPSLVLHGSPRLWPVADDQYGGAFPEHTGILRWPNTSWWLNPHPIGVAVLMLPLFLAAHLLTIWSNLPPDGFSLYYQIAASLGGLLYGAAGLSVLRRVLSRHASDGVVLATLVVITFGTNLFHYMTFDATFSHAYGFFLVACLLWITERFWQQPALPRAAQLGLVVGALFLTRHSHLLFVLVPVLYAPGRLWAQRRLLTIAAGVALAVALPQLAIYNAVTGHWVVSPYSLLPATMAFAAPEIAGVVWSLPKGLLFWSPVLLLSVAGLGLVRDEARRFRGATLGLLVLLTWLIGSWYDWQFGGSFGHRGFTDLLPLLAIPMAASLTRGWQAPAPARLLLVVVVAGATALSVFQMLQYWHGLIPFRDMTWADYQAVFLRWPW